MLVNNTLRKSTFWGFICKNLKLHSHTDKENNDENDKDKMSYKLRTNTFPKLWRFTLLTKHINHFTHNLYQNIDGPYLLFYSLYKLQSQLLTVKHLRHFIQPMPELWWPACPLSSLSNIYTPRSLKRKLFPLFHS